MDEMAKGIENSVSECQAVPVIERISRITSDWGITLPAVTPLVFDFGLGRFEEIGETEYWIANETSKGYCGKFLFLFEGQRCPEHLHKNKHETFYILKGSVDMLLHGQQHIPLSEGDSLSVNEGTLHSFLAKADTLILEVSMPGIISDNYFTDSRIGYR